MVSQIRKANVSPIGSSASVLIDRDEVVVRLKARMAELHKNQTEYAEFIGISQPLLSQIIALDRAPSEEALKDLKLRYAERYESVAAK
jgi:predicted transcriptional regulator